MLDDNGKPMHSMIALYWKAGEYVIIVYKTIFA